MMITTIDRIETVPNHRSASRHAEPSQYPAETVTADQAKPPSTLKIVKRA